MPEPSAPPLPFTHPDVAAALRDIAEAARELDAAHAEASRIARGPRDAVLRDALAELGAGPAAPPGRCAACGKALREEGALCARCLEKGRALAARRAQARYYMAHRALCSLPRSCIRCGRSHRDGIADAIPLCPRCAEDARAEGLIPSLVAPRGHSGARGAASP
jgi:hypothetical protein